MAAYAVLATVSNQPGILFGITRVLADRQANITYVDTTGSVAALITKATGVDPTSWASRTR